MPLLILPSKHVLLQAFEEKRLSKMEELFSKIPSSTSALGMENKVTGIAERFKRVVRQTKER